MTGRAPLVWQLDDPTRVIDLSPDRPHATVRRPAGAGPVFFGRAIDPEAAAVQAELARLGVPSLRVTAEDPAIGLSVTGDAVRISVRPGTSFEATVGWLRHFAGRARPPSRSSTVDRFGEDSWSALLGQLDAAGRPDIIGAGPGLIRQLALARTSGVPVPRTVITTAPGVDLALISTPRLVVKALHSHVVEAAPGRLHGIFAQVVSRAEAARWPAVLAAPVVLQEYVEHDRELRVYYLEGELRAFQVDADSPESRWLDPDRVAVTSSAVPAGVAAMTRVLAAAFGVTYAAFDFLLGPAGPVFLEANPNGDWRWFEARAGSRAVTTAATAMVLQRHRAARPEHRAALPLTRFLTG
jgi:hypothetical protein